MTQKKNSATKKTTISDIAEALGLSKTTISRAISGKGRISTETIERVQSYIEANGYRPNLIAKSLAHSKTYNLGVVLPADSNLAETPFFQKCLIGICDVAASRDYDVVVTTATEGDFSFLERIINNDKVDGVILTRSLVNDLPAQYLKEKNVPFVVIGSSEDEDIIQVDSNQIEGCSEMVTMLINSGITSIGLLAGNQNHVVNKDRYFGFTEAFRKNDIPLNEELIFLNVNNKAFVERAVTVLMEKGAECIVCTDDLICSRVLTKLSEDNYKIPEDVKVASFYGSVFLEHHNPPITTLDIDVQRLGMVAGIRLIELISGETVQHKTLLDYEIVIKKSTKS